MKKTSDSAAQFYSKWHFLYLQSYDLCRLLVLLEGSQHTFSVCVKITVGIFLLPVEMASIFFYYIKSLHGIM